MSNISTYLENKLLDHALGDTTFTKPTVWLALFTTTPTMPAGSGGVEVSGGSYARVALAGDWAAAASGSKATNALVAFTSASADWGTVVGVGIFDAATVGNLLFAGALTASKVVSSGDTFEITSGNLTAALS